MSKKSDAIKQGVIETAIMLAILGLVALVCCLTGCTSVEYASNGQIIKDSRCVVQTHSVVLGLDVQVFDFLGTGGSSPSKIRLGYVCSDTCVTPIGMQSEFSKSYENVLFGENKFSTTDKAGYAVPTSSIPFTESTK